MSSQYILILFQMHASVPYLREWLESWFWRLKFLSIKTIEAALNILWLNLRTIDRVCCLLSSMLTGVTIDPGL